MMFFAEYNPLRCGKSKESTQQSVFSTQPGRFNRKGRKDRKEWKGIARQFRKFDDPRVNHTTMAVLSDLRALCGAISLAEC